MVSFEVLVSTCSSSLGLFQKLCLQVVALVSLLPNGLNLLLASAFGIYIPYPPKTNSKAQTFFFSFLVGLRFTTKRRSLQSFSRMTWEGEGFTSQAVTNAKSLSNKKWRSFELWSWSPSSSLGRRGDEGIIFVRVLVRCMLTS